jgi:hypothetical protein
MSVGINIDDAPKCIICGSRLLVINRRNCLHTRRVLANHAGEAIQVTLYRAIVSILFAAAFSKEVARYSSDRSHLFPFNPLSRTGRHSIRDCDRSAGSFDEKVDEVGMRLRLLSP